MLAWRFQETLTAMQQIVEYIELIGTIQHLKLSEKYKVTILHIDRFLKEGNYEN